MSFVPSSAQQQAWLAIAARAPSAHNTQPARWRFSSDRIELWQDGARWLSASDPQGRDQRVGLGMAWEALALAVSQDGAVLSSPVFDDAAMPPAAGLSRVATAILREQGGGEDPLAQWQTHRHCWRGRFDVADEFRRQALLACLDRHSTIALALPDASRDIIAKWHDTASATVLHDPAVAAELYRWMRFLPASPDWSRDGLDAECLLLNRFEAWGARWAMRPGLVKWLARMGVLPMVLSESAATRSAMALIALHMPDSGDPFHAGRAWYRFWLDLAASGFAGGPMSSSVDEPRTRQRLLDAYPLPPGRTLLNLMRVGPAPAAMPASARLPVDELRLAPTCRAG